MRRLPFLVPTGDSSVDLFVRRTAGLYLDPWAKQGSVDEFVAATLIWSSLGDIDESADWPDHQPPLWQALAKLLIQSVRAVLDNQDLTDEPLADTIWETLNRIDTGLVALAMNTLARATLPIIHPKFETATDLLLLRHPNKLRPILETARTQPLGALPPKRTGPQSLEVQKFIYKALGQVGDASTAIKLTEFDVHDPELGPFAVDATKSIRLRLDPSD